MNKHIKSFENKLKDLEELIDIQAKDGNWDFDPYMTGLYNGMELAKSVMKGEEPSYKDIQESKIISFKVFEAVEIESSIKHLRGVSKELKEESFKHLKEYTRAKKGIISGLKLHADLNKKIKEKGLPNGFDMGIDKDGYYIHTHRARSKSYITPAKISVKDIKFIDSTG